LEIKKTVRNKVVYGSSGSGDPMLWELTGQKVKKSQYNTVRYICMSAM